MPVPVSEITVTISMPGFLLLGRQDMRELLSLETLSLTLILAVRADATGSQSCNQVKSPKHIVPYVVFTPRRAVPCSPGDVGSLHVCQHFHPLSI